MNARIEIHLDSPVPPFEQVRAQFETMIRTGVLPDGAKLPTVRALAGDLGLAAGTVARAYRELESAGLIRTARRSGSTVVSPEHPTGDHPPAEPSLPPAVSAVVDQLLSVSRSHGVSVETLALALRDRSRNPLPPPLD